MSDNHNEDDMNKIVEDDLNLLKFNLDQVLKLVAFLCPKNSEVPGFILKMYMVWHMETLSGLVSRPTLLPKEDFEKFRQKYKDQMKIVEEYLEKLFFRMELKESIKQANETNQIGEKK